MTKTERDQIIEDCAAVVDQCNREGPYMAIAAAPRIRALKDVPHADGDDVLGPGTEDCAGKFNNEPCTVDMNPNRCLICGFVPDWRKNAARATGG